LCILSLMETKPKPKPLKNFIIESLLDYLETIPEGHIKDLEFIRKDGLSPMKTKHLKKGASKMDHIEKVETIDTGGNMMVDLLTLESGKVVGIGEDFIILYDNMDDALNCQDLDERPIIYT